MPVDDDDAPITMAALRPLVDGLDELRQRFDDLEAADTPAARRAARDDLDDSREELEQTARKLGVSPEKLAQSIKAARDAERKDELRPILAELVQELREAEAAADDDDQDDDLDDDEAAAKKAKPAKPKPAAKPKPKPAPVDDDQDDDADDDPPGPKPDSKPAVAHWSEGRIGALLR